MKGKVVLCGGGEGEAWLFLRALRALPEAPPIALVADDPEEARGRSERWQVPAYPSFDAALADGGVSAFLLLAPFEDRSNRAREILYRKRHLAMGPPFARSAEEARRLVGMARKSHVGLVSAEPSLHLPAIRKLLELVDQVRLGRIQSLRMRSLLGGAGGWDPFLTPMFTRTEIPVEPQPDDLLFREAVEKLSIAVRILGPLAEVVRHGELSGDPKAASALLVAWKHRAEKCYGVLELLRTPGLAIRSAYDPREDSLEITGSAGMAWAHHGMGRLRHEPVLRFYLQEDLYSYERIEDDWQIGVNGAMRAFREAMEHRSIDLGSLRCTVEALATAELVVKSRGDGQRWPVGAPL